MKLPPHKHESPSAPHLLEPTLQRAFLIANNPSIDCHVFERFQLGRHDLLVEFNRAIFFDTFAAVSCHKLHFHNRNHLGSCWGFKPNGQPERDLGAQECEGLTFATTDFIPPIIHDYLDTLDRQVHRLAISAGDIPLYCYPQHKMPSAGFTALSFLRGINWIRQCQHDKPLELTIVGFTGVYPPGKAWCGHHFAFEQYSYRSWLDVRMLDADGTDRNDWQEDQRATVVDRRSPSPESLSGCPSVTANEATQLTSQLSLR